jgi:predicted porin
LAGYLPTVRAQVSAAISGTVTDQTGAAIRDVAVTIKNVETGATRTIATDGGGHYQASGLPPGGARAGQLFNDEFYAGVSSAYLGTLTFGRQHAHGTDAKLVYDPASGAYAFSYIGYNGTMAGGGDTQDSRWGDAPEVSPHLWPGPFRRDV